MRRRGGEREEGGLKEFEQGKTLRWTDEDANLDRASRADRPRQGRVSASRRKDGGRDACRCIQPATLPERARVIATRRRARGGRWRGRERGREGGREGRPPRSAAQDD